MPVDIIDELNGLSHYLEFTEGKEILQRAIEEITSLRLELEGLMGTLELYDEDFNNEV